MRRWGKILPLLLGPLAAVLLAGDGAAVAGTAVSTLSVTATVVNGCSVTVTPVNFGTYDPLAAGDLKAQGTITLICSGTVQSGGPSVAMDNGQFHAQVSGTNTFQTSGTTAATSSGVTITRSMGNAGTYLGYDLFQTASYDKVWNATQPVTPGTIGSAQPVVLPVYGDIPALQKQTLKGGTYSDTVVVTVTF